MRTFSATFCRRFKPSRARPAKGGKKGQNMDINSYSYTSPGFGVDDEPAYTPIERCAECEHIAECSMMLEDCTREDAKP